MKTFTSMWPVWLLSLPSILEGARLTGGDAAHRDLQPANDACANAIPLSFVGGVATETGNTEGATAEELTCASTVGPTLWYSFVGTGARFLIETTEANTAFQPQLVVSERACGADVASVCVADSGFSTTAAVSVDWFTTPGTTYLIAVTGYRDSRFGAFELKVTESFLPPNDACSTGTAVTPTYSTATTLVDSTANATIEETACTGATGATAWYSVTGTGGLLRISTETPETTFPAGILISERECATAATTCVENTGFISGDTRGDTIEWFTTEGTEYKIGIYGYNDRPDVYAGEYGLSVMEYILPANDKCEESMELVPGTTTDTTEIGNTSNATMFDMECARSEGRTVWYHFTGTGARIRASTEQPETEFAPQLVVSNRACDTVDANCVVDSGFTSDDFRGSAEEFWSVNGTEYKIAITAYYEDRYGQFGLSLMEYVLPENDVCESAQPLAPVMTMEPTVFASNENATYVDLGCYSRSESALMFYSVVGTGARFRISTCSPETLIDGGLILISSRDCDTVGDVCIDAGDFSSDCGEGILGVTQEWWTTPGTTYNIAVGGENDEDVGDFALSLMEYKLPVNDVCSGATPMKVGDIVSGSTANATEQALDGCFAVESSMVWYSVVGTGEPIIASTCHPDTLANNNIYISSRDCETVGSACLQVSNQGCDDGNLGAMVQFDSTAGTVYKIAVLASSTFGESTDDDFTFFLKGEDGEAPTNPAPAPAPTSQSNPAPGQNPAPGPTGDQSAVTGDDSGDDSGAATHLGLWSTIILFLLPAAGHLMLA